MNRREERVVYLGNRGGDGQSIARLPLSETRLVGVRSTDEAGRAFDAPIELSDPGQRVQVQVFVVDVLALYFIGVAGVGAGGRGGKGEQGNPGGGLFQTDRCAHCGTPGGLCGPGVGGRGRRQRRPKGSEAHEGRLKLHEGLVMAAKTGLSRGLGGPTARAAAKAPHQVSAAARSMTSRMVST